MPTWSRMVKEQLDLTGEEAITPVNFSESDLGDVIAMEDRNNFSDEWPERRVFAMLGDDCVHIFDEHGKLIHEPENGLDQGKQVINGEQGFLAEWIEEAYYRLPQAASMDAAVTPPRTSRRASRRAAGRTPSASPTSSTPARSRASRAMTTPPLPLYMHAATRWRGSTASAAMRASTRCTRAMARRCTATASATPRPRPRDSARPRSRSSPSSASRRCSAILRTGSGSTGKRVAGSSSDHKSAC